MQTLTKKINYIGYINLIINHKTSYHEKYRFSFYSIGLWVGYRSK